MTKSNRQRAILFENPDYIPMSFWVNPACWHHYPQDWLAEQMERHPLLFPDFKAPRLPYTPEYPLCARRDEPYTDDFGCLWETTDDGITGTVVRHPLEDWSAYASYQFPDPACRMGIGPVDWEEERLRIESQKSAGELAMGGLRHGHTFLQLCDLRGYSNLMFDMADEEPLLMDLIDSGVDCINLQDLVNGVDWIRENLKGRLCIDLDIDRQKVTRFGTPKEIHELILEEVRQLGSPQGGLMMIYGLYPQIPRENVEAVMDAMEKYAFYYR